jgi:hypothetical protein
MSRPGFIRTIESHDVLMIDERPLMPLSSSYVDWRTGIPLFLHEFVSHHVLRSLLLLNTK